jgi:hypothetical protein
MAKKFLDILAEAYDEDMLDAVIPSKRKPAGKSTRRSGSGRRNKRFIDSINESLPPEPSQPARKSLLETMEEALDNQIFDEIFPKRTPQTDEEDRQLESRFSTMITTGVLNRARQIADQKGIRVKDVINAALRIYVEHEWKNLK